MCVSNWLNARERDQACELANGGAQRRLLSALIHRIIFRSFQPWLHTRNHPGDPAPLPVGTR